MNTHIRDNESFLKEHDDMSQANVAAHALHGFAALSNVVLLGTDSPGAAASPRKLKWATQTITTSGGNGNGNTAFTWNGGSFAALDWAGVMGTGNPGTAGSAGAGGRLSCVGTVAGGTAYVYGDNGVDIVIPFIAIGVGT